jgi:hypothetical protein
VAPLLQNQLVVEPRRTWGAVYHTLNDLIEQSPVTLSAILRQARDHLGGWDATLAHGRRTSFFNEIHESLFNYGGLLNRYVIL